MPLAKRQESRHQYRRPLSPSTPQTPLQPPMCYLCAAQVRPVCGDTPQQDNQRLAAPTAPGGLWFTQSVSHSKDSSPRIAVRSGFRPPVAIYYFSGVLGGHLCPPQSLSILVRASTPTLLNVFSFFLLLARPLWQLPSYRPHSSSVPLSALSIRPLCFLAQCFSLFFAAPPGRYC